MQEEEQYIPPFIRRLMPKASEEEIQHAAENLRAYIKVLYDIFLEREAKERDSEQNRDHGRFEKDDSKPSNV